MKINKLNIFFKTSCLLLVVSGFTSCGGISSNEAAVYNDAIVDGETKIVAAFDTWNSAESNEDSLYNGFSTLIDSELSRVASMKSLGEDSSFKSAYLVFLTETKSFLTKETELLAKVNQTIAEEGLTPEYIEEVKKEEEILNTEFEKTQDDFMSKQKVFAEKYGLKLENK
jgi:hypothetical protein